MFLFFCLFVVGFFFGGVLLLFDVVLFLWGLLFVVVGCFLLLFLFCFVFCCFVVVVVFFLFLHEHTHGEWGGVGRGHRFIVSSEGLL